MRFDILFSNENHDIKQLHAIAYSKQEYMAQITDWLINLKPISVDEGESKKYKYVRTVYENVVLTVLYNKNLPIVIYMSIFNQNVVRVGSKGLLEYLEKEYDSWTN